MNVTKPLLPEDLQGLTKEATRLAKGSYTAFRNAMKATGDVRVPWSMLAAPVKQAHVVSYTALLRDLTRPASMDWAARLLAGKVKLKVGATAPSWSRGDTGWALTATDEAGETSTFLFTEPEIEGDTGGDTYRVVKGVTMIQNPAAALVFVCTAVCA